VSLGHASGAYSSLPNTKKGLDPRVKLLLTLAAIVGISLLPEGRWVVYAAALLALVGVTVWAGLDPFHTLRRSYVALPFALAALSLPFTVPGDPLFHLPWVNWPISVQGLVRGASLVARSWLAVQAAILLTSTTQAESIFWSLRALRVPGILVEVVGFAYRYLSLLVDEARRMIRARAARSGSRPGLRPALAWQGRVAGSMAGSLFVRSLERSERVYDAMLSRGYDGQIHLAHAPHMRRRDWALLAIALATMAAVILGVGR
jgi:cobalt/nickel transport system permease protein